MTAKWEASERIDRDHWSKFPAFKSEAARFTRPGYVFNQRSNDHIFMRWKEHFVVNDPRIDAIEGASYAGFYYVSFCRATGAISGYYYHDQSEKFQNLRLTLVEDNAFSTYAFR